MYDNSSNNKRIAKNTLFLYLRMFFVLVISLYISRAVLNILGVSDYGIYNVVAGFVLLFGFLNSTLSSSMQRFYNFEGTRLGNEGYKKVFCTGFWIHIFISIIIILLLETFGVWYINHKMVIDLERLTAANYLFQFSVVSLIIVVVQVPYISAIIAKEKMSFFAVVSIVDVLLKLAFVIILPFIPIDKLIMYGFFSLLITILTFGMYYIYCIKQFPFIKLSSNIDHRIFGELVSFSGWNLVGTFAFLLKGQGLNLLLNSFFNTVINAARGIAFQINSALSGFTNNISLAFKPQIVNSYSSENRKRTKSLMFTESKICFCLLLILIVPVCLEIDVLLKLWLGNVVPLLTNKFAILVLIDTLICTLNTPVSQIAFATGKIKNYQMGNSVVNILLIPICYWALSIGADSLSVFYITIFFSLINQVVCLILLHKIFCFSYHEYIKDVILPCFYALLLIPLLPVFIRLNMETGIFRFLTICFADVSISIVIIYYFIFNKTEKDIIKRKFV